jgi:pyridoxine 5-phosphate synthase
MVKLSVNVNKIALLRNARGGNHPSVIEFAKKAIAAGASGITVHPRPDMRHIVPDDVIQLGHWLKETPYEFNIEGNPFEEANGLFPGFMTLIDSVKPDQCTLVPDTRHQKTSDHGWDFIRDGDALRPIIRHIHDAGIRCSVFIDPNHASLEGARACGATCIELYTESYARAFFEGNYADILANYWDIGRQAHDWGMRVNAGHDLNIRNLAAFAAMPYLDEVSIGQALVTDALEWGFHNAVQAYCKVLEPFGRIS